MKNKKVIVIGIIAFALGLLVIVILLAARGGVSDKSIDKVTVQKDGKTLTVGKDGRVSWDSDGTHYEDVWDQDKVNVLFGYFGKTYSGEGELITAGENSVTIYSGGGSITYVLNDDDEITDAAGDDIENGEDDGGGDDGGGIGDIISGSSTPSPAPTSSSDSGGSDGGPDPECLYWKLSYCVRKRTPSPTPTPAASAEILPPDCDYNSETGRTSIGDDHCFITPSPTPSP